jgi:hypothetical protein
MGRFLRISILGVFLALPPLLLIVLAIPRFEAGLRLPEVKEVVLDRSLSLSVAPSRLQRAQRALANGIAEDGETKLWRAEFLALLAGSDRERLEAARQLTVDGLAAEPANPRGWTLLCELDVALSRNDAARCLDTAFYIGPFDWYVSRRRTALSVHLWPEIDADTRDAAARRLRLIWETPGLRNIDLEVARTANGQIMLEQAFADDPSSYAALERLSGIAQ